MKKEKMNDKGFSLVELIIVIAIMAVLVVVLAPQYLKYVERSRNSTDLQNATAMVTAIQVYAADPNVEDTAAFQSGATFKLTCSDTGTAVAGTAGASGSVSGDVAAKKALDEAKIDYAKTKCKSKSAWTEYYVDGTVNSDGSITFTYSSNSTESPDAFATAMTK